MAVPTRESRVVDTADGFPDILPQNIGIQLQLQCLKGQRSSVLWMQAYLRIEGERAFPDGGHHIVIGVDRDTELFSEGKILEKSCGFFLVTEQLIFTSTFRARSSRTARRV